MNRTIEQQERLDAFKSIWVKGLRSNEYKQGKKALATISNNGDIYYCCLGVGCDLLWKQGILNSHKDLDTGRIGYSDNNNKFDHLETEVFPDVVCELFGVDAEPKVYVIEYGAYMSLSHLNDQCNYTFNQIADLIENYL